MPRLFHWLLAGAAVWAGSSGCGKKTSPPRDAEGAPDAGAVVSVPTATSAGAPRPGMVWIPSGVLRAGTPLDRAPRVADEELPGTDIPLAGFYIDLFPYPNEAGAIPTTNVSRDEAQHLCEGKNKRLCTELEWERACKGPDNTTYEYGMDYRSITCMTGLVVELAARRPAGERISCKSKFGANEMHGGAWEWTDSSWGRGGKDKDLGVLRGGNAVAGELVARCANGLARPPATKGPTMGLRCCAGPRNDATVDLTITTGPSLERSAKPTELAAPLMPHATAAWKPTAPIVFEHVWTWRPVPNEVLIVGAACAREPKWSRCGLVVGRPEGDKTYLVAQFESGLVAPEIAQNGEAKKIRARGVDGQGAFVRDLAYSFGRVEVSDAKR